MRIAAALSLLLLLGVGARAAEYSEPGTKTIGGRLVYFIAEDSDEGTWNPGLYLRYRYSRRIAFEAAGDYQRHSFRENTIHTVAGQASMLLIYARERLSAYALGGVGYYAGRLQGQGFRRNLGRLGPHAGFGTEFWLNEDWAIDANYRHVWLSAFEAPVGGVARRFKRSGDQLAFGVSRRWGSWRK